MSTDDRHELKIDDVALLAAAWSMPQDPTRGQLGDQARLSSETTPWRMQRLISWGLMTKRAFRTVAITPSGANTLLDEAQRLRRPLEILRNITQQASPSTSELERQVVRTTHATEILGWLAENGDAMSIRELAGLTGINVRQISAHLKKLATLDCVELDSTSEDGGLALRPVTARITPDGLRLGNWIGTTYAERLLEPLAKYERAYTVNGRIAPGERIAAAETEAHLINRFRDSDNLRVAAFRILLVLGVSSGPVSTREITDQLNLSNSQPPKALLRRLEEAQLIKREQVNRTGLWSLTSHGSQLLAGQCALLATAVSKIPTLASEREGGGRTAASSEGNVQLRAYYALLALAVKGDQTTRDVSNGLTSVYGTDSQMSLDDMTYVLNGLRNLGFARSDTSPANGNFRIWNITEGGKGFINTLTSTHDFAAIARQESHAARQGGLA